MNPSLYKLQRLNNKNNNKHMATLLVEKSVIFLCKVLVKTKQGHNIYKPSDQEKHEIKYKHSSTNV